MAATLAGVAVALTLGGGASLAHASGEPPQIRELHEERVYATRAHIEVEALLGNNQPPQAKAHWRAEYITVQALEEAEKRKEPATWTLGGEEETEGRSDFEMPLGATDATGQYMLHHLQPATAYDVRFRVENEAKEIGEKTFGFTTKTIGEPEVADREFSTFREVGLTPTSARFTAQIESNGAPTVYSFEYEESLLGPWMPFISGGTGTVTVAEDFANPTASLTGLSPETTYYIRLKASNREGEIIQTTYARSGEELESFTTPTAKPQAAQPNVRNVTGGSAHIEGAVTPRGSETEWRFEYIAARELEEAEAHKAQANWLPVPGAEARGVISQAEAEALYKNEGVIETEETGPVPTSARFEARLTGLNPGTAYYVRLSAKNAFGAAEAPAASFETTGLPIATAFATHGLHGEALRLLGDVDPNSVPTSDEQRITVEGSPTGGTFGLTFAGQSTGGTITGNLTSGANTISDIPLAAARGTGNVVPEGENGAFVTDLTTSAGHFRPGQTIAGPSIVPGTIINYIDESSAEGTVLHLGRGVRASTTIAGAELTSAGPNPFSVGETISGPGIPANTTITEVRYPSNFTGSLTLSTGANATVTGAELSANIPYDAGAQTVENALRNLLSVPANAPVSVYGGPGGPYTVSFDAEHSPLAESNQPQIGESASGLTPSRSIGVTTTQPGGVAYDTHYHFEYVSQKQFEAEGGFAKAASTPEVDAGSGGTPQLVGTDLSGLTAGETYRYRISATSNFPGDPVVHGTEQTLQVPTPAATGAAQACPNQALRTGPSSDLPDCRAYEQVTPVDKEGSQEIFKYAGLSLQSTALIGEDGDHVAVEAPFVHWGSGDAGESPYFFSREEGKGWRMTAGTVQPEAGLNSYTAQLFSSNLTQFGFESSALIFGAGGTSKDIEFRAGPPGGPYANVATVPRAEVGKGGGWVGADASFSKLLLQVEDHKLLGKSTGTTSGADLYEYAGGALRQVNVDSTGAPLGVCGAYVVNGNEEVGGGQISSPHAVSADGSRVFFEAVPGENCSEPSHLYVRINGAETLDLGTYRFLAANAEGTEVLLERRSGEDPGIYLYSGASGQPKLLAQTAGLAGARTLTVSQDLEGIYLESSEQLTPEAPALSPALGFTSDLLNVYRYDVATETLSFVAQINSEESVAHLSGPDGRYYYFTASRVGGLPGGASVPGGGVEIEHKLAGEGYTPQVYRYDSVEHLIQCVSCASPFDPEPRLGSDFGNGGSGQADGPTGTPKLTLASANGEFAFFQTPAALVPQDVDGEVTPEGTTGSGPTAPENASSNNSASGDVYEWRRDGAYGCAHLQGCLALITNGRGGYLNLLLGSAEEGRDVFIYTSSRLVAQDDDTAGDIYDARIDGGFPPPPPKAVECEGDACSTPASAPNDATPASFTFTGEGNIATGPMTRSTAKSTKPKAKRKRARRSGKARRKKKVGKSAKGRK